MKNKIFLLTLIAALGLFGCGGSGSDSDTDSDADSNSVSGSSSETFTTSKSLGQTVMMLVLGFAPTPPTQKMQSVKTTSQACANGGSMRFNDDGSITFSNCSFFDGYLFNGTITVTPQTGEGQGGRIDFDNFSGTLGDETGFEMDGYIKETENDDGSLDFDVNLDTTTTFMGEPSIFNMEGDFSIGDDGTMTGSMSIDDGIEDSPNTLCNFDDLNIFEFQTEGGGGALMDSACKETNTPIS